MAKGLWDEQWFGLFHTRENFLYCVSDSRIDLIATACEDDLLDDTTIRAVTIVYDDGKRRKPERKGK